jgi:hypothetical protein
MLIRLLCHINLRFKMIVGVVVVLPINLFKYVYSALKLLL